MPIDEHDQHDCQEEEEEEQKQQQQQEQEVLRSIFNSFVIPDHPRFVSAEPFGSGHINDTFRVRVRYDNDNDDHDDGDGDGDGGIVDAATRRRKRRRLPQFYILQRINTSVFTRPVEVMENIIRVTEHLSSKIRRRGGDPLRETLTFYPSGTSNSGMYYHVHHDSRDHDCVDGMGVSRDGDGDEDSDRDRDRDRDTHGTNDDNAAHGGTKSYWRVAHFIDGAIAYDVIPSDEGNIGLDLVRSAATAFATFQQDLSDMPSVPRLHETIARFGDASFRFQQLERAIEDIVVLTTNADANANADSDAKDSRRRRRLDDCWEEIRFCMDRKRDARVLSDLVEDGVMPERIVHFDTKINNVLFEMDKYDGSGNGNGDANGNDNDDGHKAAGGDGQGKRGRRDKALCVIDLDTVMPGMAVYDFGDAVRTATAFADEDETDLSKVGFSMERFDALADGYLSIAAAAKNVDDDDKDDDGGGGGGGNNEGGFITDVEADHLAFAAKIVTFTIGVRFLTDYLNGDVYFKVLRDGHNLDRARAQFKMVRDMEDRFEEMKAVVEKYRLHYSGNSNAAAVAAAAVGR